MARVASCRSGPNARRPLMLSHFAADYRARGGPVLLFVCGTRGSNHEACGAVVRGAGGGGEGVVRCFLSFGNHSVRPRSRGRGRWRSDRGRTANSGGQFFEIQSRGVATPPDSIS